MCVDVLNHYITYHNQIHLNLPPQALHIYRSAPVFNIVIIQLIYNDIMFYYTNLAKYIIFPPSIKVQICD